MYCHNCGHALKGAEPKFCMECGSAVDVGPLPPGPSAGGPPKIPSAGGPPEVTERRRAGGRATIAVVVALVVLGVVAIGATLDSDEPPAAVDVAALERSISQASEAVGGMEFAVQCPESVPVEAGSTFECSVRSLDSSVEFTVVASQTDSQGSVDWEFPAQLTDADLGYTGGPAGDAIPSEAPNQPGPAPSASFVMPSVVGMVLQDAQDLLQANGSYLMDQVDATGLGRFQVLDSNWKVCAQSPAAGVTVGTDQLITLSAVKLDESC